MSYEYALHFHKGVPAKSEVVHQVLFWADNDIAAGKRRRELEKAYGLDFDFTLLCQASYLALQGLLMEQECRELLAKLNPKEYGDDEH